MTQLLMTCSGKISGVGAQTYFRLTRYFSDLSQQLVVLTNSSPHIHHGAKSNLCERQSHMSRVTSRPCWHIKQTRGYSLHPQQASFFHTSSTLRSDADNSNRWLRKVTVYQPSSNNSDKVLSFDVTVLDTFPDDDEQKRCTVVAIHGFPGTGAEFQSLAAKLYDKGIRVVAPSALGQLDSPIDLKLLPEIDFSTKGRTRNLQLLLIAMNIHRVDMLLAHSGGAWTMYEAGSHWNNISSLFAINPGGAEPNRPLRPFWAIKALAVILQQEWMRRIFMPLLVWAYQKMGFRNVTRNGSGDHLVVTQQFIAKLKFEEVLHNAKLIQLRQTPLILAYSLNDKILEPHICAQMAYNHLGIPIENTVFIGEECIIPQGWLTRCLVFARGGHILHLAEEDLIVSQIVDVLRMVCGRRANCTMEDNDVPRSCSN